MPEDHVHILNVSWNVLLAGNLDFLVESYIEAMIMLVMIILPDRHDHVNLYTINNEYRECHYHNLM